MGATTPRPGQDAPGVPPSTAAPPDFLGLPRRGISLQFLSETSFPCLETALGDPLQQLLMVNSPDITGAGG